MSDKSKSPATFAQWLKIPVSLTFVSAGLCFVSAGYLATTGSAWRDLYELVGVSLPFVSQFVIENPVGLPLGLIAAGMGVLGLTRVRIRDTDLNRAVSALGLLGAIGAGLFACGLLYTNTLVFEELQVALQQ
jgi:hypothetical protein